MDNFKPSDVKNAYDSGDRAVLLHSKDCGELHVYTKTFHNRYLPVYNPDFWHALRAYQDAERKKGAPIELDKVQQEEWYKLQKPDNYEYTYYLMGGLNEWSVPGIDVFNSNSMDCKIAEFKNFRWKAGHPKNEELDQRKAWGGAWTAKNPDGSYVLPWQKGGQNGD